MLEELNKELQMGVSFDEQTPEIIPIALYSKGRGCSAGIVLTKYGLQEYDEDNSSGIMKTTLSNIGTQYDVAGVQKVLISKSTEIKSNLGLYLSALRCNELPMFYVSLDADDKQQFGVEITMRRLKCF